jgi:pectate lyase
MDNPDVGVIYLPYVRRAATQDSPVLAFPGAEGFGANSVGGRGGRVIEVTNLNDSGPGSLRAAIEAGGPRIVVFRTGGTIELQSGLEISNPFITIAGQTAPGGGITLKNVPSNMDAALTVTAHDVIIRYIRSRPGASTRQACCLDAIQILTDSAYNVIIDHCSASWATDETMSTWYDPHDITIQWCIISEGLLDSTHEEGPHSKGLLLGSDGSYNISVHHNLFAHNVERAPLIKTSGLVDVVNNVMYNPEWSASHVTDDYSKALLNYVGNYFKRGPDSTSEYSLATSNEGGNGLEIFVQGNIGPNRPRDDIDYMDESLVVKPEGRQWIVETRHDAPFVTTTSAIEAYDQVLANAGATIGLDSQGNSYWRRDPVDGRIVNDVRNGTGSYIDDPSEVGGWPELAAGTAPPDSDHDGMPDQWERLYCLGPSDPSDGPFDADGDGYTNVEEYLNGTEPRSICASGQR